MRDWTLFVPEEYEITCDLGQFFHVNKKTSELQGGRLKYFQTTIS